MTAPRIISLLFLLFLAVVGELCAQDTLVVPGARVRVYSPDRVTGTIETLSSDTLVLRTEARRSLQAIPFASITKLEVSRGRKSNVGKGARIGLAVGAGVGAIAGVILIIGECSGSAGCLFYSVAGGVAGALYLFLPGTLLGAVIGAVFRTDLWETVPLDRIRVSLRPNDHLGVAVSVRIAF